MNSEKVKAPKLTEKQEQVFYKIKQTPGGHLRLHKKHTGELCYKLMDNEHRPIELFGLGIVQRIIEKEFLIKKDNVIVVKHGV